MLEHTSCLVARHDENSDNVVVSKYTARGYEEPHSVLLARCLDKRDQGHEAFVADYTQAFLNAEVREGELLYAQPPEGWNPKILTDGRRVVWRVHKAMLGLRTSETLARTFVWQVKRTWLCSRRSVSVCER